jgi:hypothetical protein
MNETNVLPEDRALAEKIATFESIAGCGRKDELSRIIAAHRPPLVERLVS